MIFRDQMLPGRHSAVQNFLDPQRGSKKSPPPAKDPIQNPPPRHAPPTSNLHLPPLHISAVNSVNQPVSVQFHRYLQKEKEFLQKPETNMLTVANGPRLPGGLLRKAQELSQEHAQLERKLSQDYNKQTATRAGQLSTVTRALKEYENAIHVRPHHPTYQPQLTPPPPRTSKNSTKCSSTPPSTQTSAPKPPPTSSQPKPPSPPSPQP